jgi:outer membrane protein assembly factor BamA
MNHIKFEVTLDKRNSKIFPLSGYLIKSELARQGLFKGESIHLWYVKLSGGYYSKFHERIYTGFDVLGKVSTKTNLPYFLNEALGFKDFIRGYEYYVTNGSQYIINKNSIKFELLPTKVINLPVIPDGRFKKAHLAIFWSVFADTGFVKPDSNTPNKNLEGNFLYGYGTGLYVVAYYDMVFRVEYSTNIFNEWGIFLHFGTPFLNN